MFEESHPVIIQSMHVDSQFLIFSEPKTLKDFLQQPSLVRFRYKYSMDTESAMDLVCLTGIVLSFLATLSSAFRSTLSFFFMWVLYMSLYSVGQTFLWFQW